jgi:sugar phosphate isomerase/epimerase
MNTLSGERLALSPVAVPQCPFEDAFAVVATAGFRGIGLRYNLLEDFLHRGHELADVKRLLRRFDLVFTEGGFLAEWQFHGGVPLVCGRKRQGGPEESNDVLVARLRTFFERCAELECINITAAVALHEIGDLGTAANDLASLCDLAQPYGLRICVEFIGSAPQVKDARTASQMVEAAKRPNAGLVVDTFFVHQGSTRLTDLAAVPIERILNVQLADAKPGPPEKLNMLEDRLFPGEGVARVQDVVSCLYRRGYAGWWTVELFNPEYRTLPAQEVANHAFRTADALLKKTREELQPS